MLKELSDELSALGVHMVRGLLLYSRYEEAHAAFGDNCVSAVCLLYITATSEHIAGGMSFFIAGAGYCACLVSPWILPGRGFL